MHPGGAPGWSSQGSPLSKRLTLAFVRDLRSKPLLGKVQAKPRCPPYQLHTVGAAARLRAVTEASPVAIILVFQ